jgi:hypothetical protein
MTARYQIIECEQGSPEWHEARRGLPTASRYGDVLAQGQGKMRNKYRRQLAAEIESGKVMKTHSNAHMERGKEEQDEILMKYVFQTDAELQKVGFLRYTLMSTGCSPDGLIGKDGMVEIKSMLPELLVELHETGKIPTEHTPQVQGGMWITGRKWCDLVLGSPGLPLIVHRIQRDEPYMAGLQRELQYFIEEVAQLAKFLKGKR